MDLTAAGRSADPVCLAGFLTWHVQCWMSILFSGDGLGKVLADGLGKVFGQCWNSCMLEGICKKGVSAGGARSLRSLATQSIHYRNWDSYIVMGSEARRAELKKFLEGVLANRPPAGRESVWKFNIGSFFKKIDG